MPKLDIHNVVLLRYYKYINITHIYIEVNGKQQKFLLHL